MKQLMYFCNLISIEEWLLKVKAKVKAK